MNSCERFGYGKEYNEENNIVYDGFMFGDRRICHGKEYRGVFDKNSRNRLVYDGEYCDGVRYGYGKSYDLNGEVEYEDEWIDNIPIHEIEVKSGVFINRNDLLLPVFIEEIIIADELFHDREISSFHLSNPFIQLRNIEIGDKCFNNFYEFVLDGLGKLESVKIGVKCFRISEYERNDGVCRKTNFPNLR